MLLILLYVVFKVFFNSRNFVIFGRGYLVYAKLSVEREIGRTYVCIYIYPTKQLDFRMF